MDDAIATAAMLVAAANDTATVRVLRSAACPFALVVSPLPTVTVHCVPAASVAVPAVSVSVVVAVPEFDAAAVNVVDPQPLDLLTPDGDAMVKVGSTSSILSAVPVCCNGALSSNVYDTDDGDHEDNQEDEDETYN